MNTTILHTEIIKPKGCMARLMNELSLIIMQSHSVTCTNINNGHNIEIQIDNNKYSLFLCADYPFKIPQNVCYNNIEYKTLLYDNRPEINKYLLKYYNKECFCCSSLLCGVNWSPCTNILKIINEINQNIKIKQEINYRLISDELRKKYKCYFVDFESYLF